MDLWTFLLHFADLCHKTDLQQFWETDVFWLPAQSSGTAFQLVLGK